MTRREHHDQGTLFIQGIYQDCTDFKSPVRYCPLKDNEVNYYLLTINEYLKVYNRSLKDGYRRTKNNNKDLKKIEILTKLVGK